jgi:microsomal dipeptidase-like Zn-dependent dipeptidase
MPFDVIVKNIRAVGIESTVLGSDFGQAKNVPPVEGMKTYLQQLYEAGFSETEIERMAVKTPSALLNI